MDDLIKMCDKLEKCRKKNPDYKGDIECTERMLKTYIDGNTERLRTIKAQLKIHNRNMYDDFGPISFLVSMATLCITIFERLFGDDTAGYTIIALIIILLIFIIFEIFVWGARKFGHRDKWKRYIEVVLEDMEKRNDLNIGSGEG